MPFLNETIWNSLVNVLDIVVVWIVIYKLITVIQGTKAVQLLKGIVIIVVVRMLSSLLGLHTLQMLMDQALTWGFLAIIIIFQPELRRALEQLGRGKLFARTNGQEFAEHQEMIQAMVKSTEYMAKRRIGALISIERETGMNEYIETGIPIDGVLSSEMLTNIFIPNTPLHDGAVILKGTRILAASCYLPLSESPFISKELGTRHRAALGISEVTDALTIIVSEETGAISITKNGELLRDLTKEMLEQILLNELKPEEKQSGTTIWNWRFR
ncbi:MAG: diadenylate cyclase CdaA [Bacilli bacterium]